MSPRILLHGSGAIGTIYVYLLSKAGYDVTAVCRSNHDAAKANGFVIDSEIYGNGLKVHPNVVRTPAEAAEQGPIDFLLVATKARPEAETSKTIAPAVTKGRTCIVLLQNGVGIEDEYAEAFPDNALLTCVVQLPSTEISPGHMQMGKFEGLEVGTFPAAAYREPAHKKATDDFVEMMQKAGSNTEFFPDVQENRWNKLIINAAWNPTSSLTLSRDVAFLLSSEGAGDQIEALMLEVVRIAQALGYTKFTDDTPRERIERAKSRIGTIGIQASMLSDVLSGRRMEVETILGNPVRMAKKLGVPVPRLELLYALTKSLDLALAYRKPGESLLGDFQSSMSNGA